MKDKPKDPYTAMDDTLPIRRGGNPASTGSGTADPPSNDGGGVSYSPPDTDEGTTKGDPESSDSYQ